MTNYPYVGSTHPADPVWRDRPLGVRAHESTVILGRGDERWERASRDVLTWAVKTRSGFTVDPPDEISAIGSQHVLHVRIGLLGVAEPITVVAVVDLPDRRGFAYGTRDGHPVRGEEAFIVHRSVDGTVGFTQRSLTQAPAGRWRLAFPAVLIAQRWYRRRYRRALR